ncbi:HNH endonuclease [Rhizobium laguerreae]|uniref:HNH endonuclease n=1 Tax=Rhizobium laguerreae TaxID=1076926 RepID=UPI001C915F98|nr:HNH endonuclease [Rhizobium laguerreae]MBY3297647.1 HNH endonuclease [Rhizobium laguerreae]
MLVLDFPVVKDEASLKQILKDSKWLPYSAAWRQAYKNYDTVNGDPWRIAPVGFREEEAEKQRALYKSRSSRGGPIGRIRSQGGLKCCPMCGSPMTGSLDHYLPKEDYPEFSIYSKNLVPACPACNSGTKGVTYCGKVPSERFLHPYFDKIASGPIWRVVVKPPFAAPAFEAQVLPGPPPSEQEQIAFHLAHILGEQFHLNIATSFGCVPQQIRDDLERMPVIDCKATQVALGRLLRSAVTTGSTNGWGAALCRGILSDPAVIAHIAAQANLLSPTPISSLL